MKHSQLVAVIFAYTLGNVVAIAPAEARYTGSGPACVTGIGVGKKLPVRRRASRSARRVGFLDREACYMNIEAVEGRWTYIRGTDHRGNNIQGWVRNRFLRPAGQAGKQPGGPGFPVEAASGGGQVRGGPGRQFRKIGTLKEFEPVTVLGREGSFSGYPWFRIRFQGGRIGYQWGGLICWTRERLEGTFDNCENFRRSLYGGNQPSQQPQQPPSYQPAPPPGRTVTNYTCDEGIPLVVEFLQEGNEYYALYSHDGGPKNRVAARPGGSGFHYSNGYHELRGKGFDISLFEGGELIHRCRAN